MRHFFCSKWWKLDGLGQMWVFIFYFIHWGSTEVFPLSDSPPLPEIAVSPKNSEASNKKNERKFTETDEGRTSQPYRSLAQGLTSNHEQERAQSLETLKELLSDRTTRSKTIETLEAKLRNKETPLLIRHKIKKILSEFKEEYGIFPFCTTRRTQQRTPRLERGTLIDKDSDTHIGNGESCELAISNLKNQRDKFAVEYLKKARNRNITILPKDEELVPEKICCQLAISGPFQTHATLFYVVSNEEKTDLSLSSVEKKKTQDESPYPIPNLEKPSQNAFSLALRASQNSGISESFQKIFEAELTTKLSSLQWSSNRISLTIAKFALEVPTLEERLSRITEKNLNEEETKAIISAFEGGAAPLARKILVTDVFNNILLNHAPLKLSKTSKAEQEAAKELLENLAVKKITSLIPSFVSEEQAYLQEKLDRITKKDKPRDLSSEPKGFFLSEEWEKSSYNGPVKEKTNPKNP